MDAESITPRGAMPSEVPHVEERLIHHLTGKCPVVMFDWTDMAQDDECTTIDGVSGITDLVGSRKFTKPLTGNQAFRLARAVASKATHGLSSEAAWVWTETVPFGFKVGETDPDVLKTDVCPQEETAFHTFVVVRMPSGYLSWYMDRQCPCVEQDHPDQPRKMTAPGKAYRNCVYCQGYGKHTLRNAAERYLSGESP